MALMRDRLVWKGTASQLLSDLESCTEEGMVKSRYWPKAPNRLWFQLNRLIPDLKALGVKVILKEIRGTKTYVLEKEVKVSAPSAPYEDTYGQEPRQGKLLSEFNQGADTPARVPIPLPQGADTFQGADRGADTKNTIGTPKTYTQQAFKHQGADGADKNTPLSSQSQKKQDSKQEVIVDADEF